MPVCVRMHLEIIIGTLAVLVLLSRNLPPLLSVCASGGCIRLQHLFFRFLPVCTVTVNFGDGILQWREVDDFLSVAVFGSVITHRDNEYLLNYFLRKPHHSFPLSLQNSAFKIWDTSDSSSCELRFFWHKYVCMLEMVDFCLGVTETGGACVKRSWLPDGCLAVVVDLL